MKMYGFLENSTFGLFLIYYYTRWLSCCKTEKNQRCFRAIHYIQRIVLWMIDGGVSDLLIFQRRIWIDRWPTFFIIDIMYRIQ